MSETQTEHETDAGPGFASAPWKPERPDESGHAHVWGSDGDLVATVCDNPVYGETGYDRARLIAAAGTAAGKLPDKYDSVEVIQQIPEIARLIDRLYDETHGEGDPDLDQSFRTAPSRGTIDRLIGVLIGAEGSGNE